MLKGRAHATSATRTSPCDVRARTRRARSCARVVDGGDDARGAAGPSGSDGRRLAASAFSSPIRASSSADLGAGDAAQRTAVALAVVERLEARAQRGDGGPLELEVERGLDASPPRSTRSPPSALEEMAPHLLGEVRGLRVVGVLGRRAQRRRRSPMACVVRSPRRSCRPRAGARARSGGAPRRASGSGTARSASAPSAGPRAARPRRRRSRRPPCRSRCAPPRRRRRRRSRSRSGSGRGAGSPPSRSAARCAARAASRAACGGSVRSGVSSMLFTSCCVIVLAPCVISPPAEQVRPGGAHDRHVVDARVLEEGLVLGGDEGLHDVGRQLVEVDQPAALLVELADRPARPGRGPTLVSGGR